MGQRLKHDHRQRGGNDRLDKCHAHLVAVRVKRRQKNGIEHRIQQEPGGKQRQIGIQPHQVVLPRLQADRQQGAGHQHRQRQQLDQRREQTAGLYRVPFGNRQQRRVVQVLLLPHIQKGEKQPQHHIEKDDSVGVVWNDDHEAEQAEYRRHGMAHQPQLLI